MVETEVAKRQTLRLTGLSKFPLGHSEAEKAARMELVGALQRVSRDPEHAGRIISRWLEQNRFAPTPADIFEIGRQSDREYQPQHWTCAACDGTGWREVLQHVVWTSGNNKNVREISAEEYERLRPKVQTTARKKHREPDPDKIESLTGCEVSGMVGQDIVQKAMVRCTSCRTGRMRAEAEMMEQNEAEAKKHA
jgi:hypothetical protein